MWFFVSILCAVAQWKIFAKFLAYHRPSEGYEPWIRQKAVNRINGAEDKTRYKNYRYRIRKTACIAATTHTGTFPKITDHLLPFLRMVAGLIWRRRILFAREKLIYEMLLMRWRGGREGGERRKMEDRTIFQWIFECTDFLRFPPSIFKHFHIENSKLLIS